MRCGSTLPVEAPAEGAEPSPGRPRRVAAAAPARPVPAAPSTRMGPPPSAPPQVNAPAAPSALPRRRPVPLPSLSGLADNDPGPGEVSRSSPWANDRVGGALATDALAFLAEEDTQLGAETESFTELPVGGETQPPIARVGFATAPAKPQPRLDSRGLETAPGWRDAPANTQPTAAGDAPLRELRTWAESNRKSLRRASEAGPGSSPAQRVDPRALDPHAPADDRTLEAPLPDLALASSRAAAPAPARPSLEARAPRAASEGTRPLPTHRPAQEPPRPAAPARPAPAPARPRTPSLAPVMPRPLSASEDDEPPQEPTRLGELAGPEPGFPVFEERLPSSPALRAAPVKGLSEQALRPSAQGGETIAAPGELAGQRVPAPVMRGRIDESTHELSSLIDDLGAPDQSLSEVRRGLIAPLPMVRDVSERGAGPTLQKTPAAPRPPRAPSPPRPAPQPRRAPSPPAPRAPAPPEPPAELFRDRARLRIQPEHTDPEPDVLTSEPLETTQAFLDVPEDFAPLGLPRLATPTQRPLEVTRGPAEVTQSPAQAAQAQAGELRLRLASPLRRWSALAIDATLTAALIAVPAFLGLFGDAVAETTLDPDGLTALVFGGHATPLALFAGVSLFVFSTVAHGLLGRSPGKLALGLEVVAEATGERPGFLRAALRSLLALLGLAGCGAGYLWLLLDRRSRGLHDRLAGTAVVVASSRQTRP